jgi:hypothetical protein
LNHVVTLAVIVAAASTACKGTEPVVPQATTVQLRPTAVNFASLGATQQLRAAVLDQRGDTIAGAAVTWLSSDTTVATVSATGLVLAARNGSAQVTARAGTVTSPPATVIVDQIPASLAKIAGDFQADTVGQQLAGAITVRVNDARGNPIAGETVNFTVTQGGGSLSSPSGVTDAIGQTSTSWTLGTVAGSQLARSSAGAVGAVTFTALALAGPPADVLVAAGQGQTAIENTAVAVAPAVRVRDQFNNNRPNATVTFAVTGGGGSVVSSVATTGTDGIATAGRWTVGPAGPQNLSATVTGTGITGNPIAFTANAVVATGPATVAVSAGDSQTGLLGFALNVPPTVIVLDSNAFPVANAQVTFAIASGGGSITGPAVVSTGANGIAAVGQWIIGGSAGPNTLTATVTGAGITGNPVTFTATAQTGAYNVDVRFVTAVTPAQRAAFDSAEAKWERLIYGDVEDGAADFPAGTCGAGTPVINETIDDVIIFVQIETIDGPGGTLGSAGPCLVRDPGNLPGAGLMRFDSADVAMLIAGSQFDEVILHEMGHVLGYGTIWPETGLLVGPVSSGGSDPHFIGDEAIAAFDQGGGAAYSAGAKVPVENCVGFPPGVCGPGNQDGHWRELVFENELMTGFINAGTTPLSRITTASMGDLGYLVNNAASDPYTVANALAIRQFEPSRLLELRDDILRMPIIVIDTRGRVVRVIQPR